MTTRQKPILYVCMIIVMLVVVTAAQADTIYVGPAETHTTIQAAVNAADPGDVIIVRDGVYNEKVTISADDNITVQSENDSSVCTVNNTSDGTSVFYITTNNVTIQGFTITGGETHEGVFCLGTDLTVQNCYITGNAEGCDLRGSNATVQYTLFDNNTSKGILIMAEFTGIIIQDNVLNGNSTAVTGIDNFSSITMTNNHIYNFTTEGYKGNNASSVTARGNKITDNQYGVYLPSGAAGDFGQDSEPGKGRNTIMNNSSFNLVNVNLGTIDAYRNYWGSTNAGTIDATIYDDDEGSVGAVNFQPFLSGDESLPVQAVTAMASVAGRTVTLYWTTESETDNAGFTIERCIWDTQFEEISSYLTEPSLVGAGTTTNRTEYQFTDASVEPGANYTYRINAVDIAGKSTQVAFIELTIDALPKTTELLPAYPNPFNPKTKISYKLAEDSEVSLTVMNLLGHPVAHLVRGDNQQAGSYHIFWDGTSDSGLNAPSGTYLVRLKAGTARNVQKITLIR